MNQSRSVRSLRSDSHGSAHRSNRTPASAGKETQHPLHHGRRHRLEQCIRRPGLPVL